MNQIAKKLLLCVGILSVTMVSGCSSDDSSKKKETAKNEEKAEVKMVANDVYVEPLNPTQAQIEAYNKLSQAITSEDRKEEATMVAVSFAFDFFTLSNKEDAQDLGGLQFIPSDKIRNFMEFAQAYYYGNYPTIVNEYGKKSLPEVSGYKVDAVEAKDYTYNGSACRGYDVKLTLTYAETEVESLKKSMTISVIEIQDYEYDRTKNYKKDVIYDGEMKNVYRVLAVE